VIKGIPYVDELIYWDPVTIHADSRGTHRTWKEKWGFIGELRARRFDKVYVLKRSLSSAIMALLSGASERIGFATEGRGLLLTKSVPYRTELHEVENFLAVLQADGIEVMDNFLECWPFPDEDAAAQGLIADAGLSPGKPLVAIHPFAANPHRGWPLEDFAAMAALMSDHGYTPLLLGAPGDRSDLEAAQALFGTEVVDLVGRCSLRVSMALLKRCSLFIGNDSGVMHLAAAAGIPLVALFGPQSPVRFGPWSKRAAVIYKKFKCSPCRQKFFTECEPSPRQRPACIEAITVDEVFAESMALLHAEPRKERDER
jgi:heptosyltransferase-2